LRTALQAQLVRSEQKSPDFIIVAVDGKNDPVNEPGAINDCDTFSRREIVCRALPFHESAGHYHLEPIQATAFTLGKVSFYQRFLIACKAYKNRAL
jgi:hypothetical protein